jgi:membrane-bound serine protease (ClpP class)
MDRLNWLVCLVFWSISFSGLCWSQAPINVETLVTVIPLNDIDPGICAYVKRAVKGSLSHQASIVVFEINIQSSSDVLAAIEFTKIIEQLRKDHPSLKCIALIPQQALSLGAFMALACQEIYMLDGARFGEATRGIGLDSPAFIAAFRKEISNLALKNNHNPELAEAMVDPEMELKEISVAGETAVVSTNKAREMQEDPMVGEVLEVNTIVAKGQVLVLEAKQAEKYFFSKTAQDTEKDFFRVAGIVKPKVHREQITWSENLVSWLTTWYISALLLAVGFIGLWLEFKAPGFGVFGVLGVLCLSLLFISKYMAGLAQIYEIVLIFVGILLLAVEFFVLPGTFVCGVLGAVSLGAGMILSFQNYVFPDPSKPWQIRDFVNNISAVLASLSITMIGFLSLLQYLPHSSLFRKRFMLTEASPNSGGLLDQQKEMFGSLLGQKGVCLTELRPAGRIEIGDEFYVVVSTGDFIARGSKIQIVDVSSNRIMVEKLED